MDEWFVLKSSSSVRSTVESTGLNQFCNHNFIGSQEPQPDRTWMNQVFFRATDGRADSQAASGRKKFPWFKNFSLKKKIIVVRLDVDDADIMFPSTTAHVKLNYGGRKKKKIANSTRCSQAVTHPSTNRARRCLTSVIGREPVFSTWYGRCRE